MSKKISDGPTHTMYNQNSIEDIKISTDYIKLNRVKQKGP